MIPFTITSEILRNKLQGGFLGYGTKSTGRNSNINIWWVYIIKTSVKQRKPLNWEWKGNLRIGRKYLWTINLRVIYLEYIKNSYKLTIKTLIQFKSEQSSWLQISPETYIWPRSMWKVTQRHCRQGNANQSHNKILSPC